MGLPIALIIAAVVKAAATQVAGSMLTVGKREQIADTAVETLQSSPEFINATNQEGLGSSRTFYASTAAFLVGAFMIRDQVVTHGLYLWLWDSGPDAIAQYVAVLAGLYGMWGRAATGLKPMWSRITAWKKRVKGE